jgi:hypothetical protein
VVDETVVPAIRASRFEPIFNGHAPGEAPLRHMGRDARSWATQLEGVFSAVLGEAGGPQPRVEATATARRQGNRMAVETQATASGVALAAGLASSTGRSAAMFIARLRWPLWPLPWQVHRPRRRRAWAGRAGLADSARETD